MKKVKLLFFSSMFVTALWSCSNKENEVNPTVNVANGTTANATAAAKDLRVTVTNNPGTVLNAGATKSYTFTVKNVGTSSTSSTSISISSPFGYSATGSVGNLSVPSLAPGASKSYTIHIAAINPGASASITANLYNAAADTGDSVSSNNITVLNITTNSSTTGVDLVPSFNYTSNKFVAGQTKTFTLYISNIGNLNSAPTTFTFTPPFGYSSNMTGTIDIPSISVGSNYSIIFSITANAAGATGNGTVTFTSGSGGDSNPGNNTAVVNVSTAP